MATPEQDAAYWRAVAMWMADVHAANAQNAAIIKSTSKSERRRQARIAQVVSRNAFWRSVRDERQCALVNVDCVFQREVFFQFDVVGCEFVLLFAR